MKKAFRNLTILLGGLLGVGVAWRLISRKWTLPCPSWLGWLMENPIMEASADQLLDSLDLQMGMRILDVGSGPGRLTLPAAERIGPHGEVVALDMQPAMLRRLESRAEAKRLTNIRLILGKAGGGLLARDYFDRALLVNVLGEIPSPELALTEIFQALKPGGILSITETIPDPHFQTRMVVQHLAVKTGFEPHLQSKNYFGFTMQLVKPVAEVVPPVLEEAVI